MGKAALTLVAALALFGCSGTVTEPTQSHEGHDHGAPEDTVDDTHSHPPDGPCTVDSYGSLFPHLQECELSGASLEGQNLRRADLSQADLSDVQAAKVDLFKAVLTGATLARADLAEANLTSADLSGADLSSASLKGARLTNAKLSGALLEWAETDSTTTCVTGQMGPCW